MQNDGRGDLVVFLDQRGPVGLLGELYDYDMVCVAQEFYKTFWHYDLSETEAQQMLARSTLKTGGSQ